MRKFLTALAMVWLATWAAFAQDAAPQEGIVIEGAYSYPPIGASKVGVGFMLVTNHTDVDYTIQSVSSEAYAAVELHTHLHEDGMMKMRKVNEVKVPAGESVAFEPGGLHLMMMNAKHDVLVGDALKLTVTLKPADRDVTLEIPLSMPVNERL